MNPSATISLAQMILSWSLLGVLCAWMLFFAFLAFRPLKAEKQEMADLPTPSGAFPALVPQTPLGQLSPLPEQSLGGLATVSTESTSDIGTVPVA